MALINCHECKREVSTEAKTCPSCGAKVRLPKKPVSPTMKAFFVLLGVGVFASVAIESNRKEETTKASEQRLASMTHEQRESEKTTKTKRDSQLHSVRCRGNIPMVRK